MAKQNIQSVRGMNDMLPEHAAQWHFLEQTFVSLAHRYGYSEMRTPIVESTDLFKRSIGEVTDIVEKEMYTFDDRNGDSLTLRPEGTASIVRAVIENGLLQQRLKLWYNGPMFRHERPQKGRYRQFHQLGCEVFGLAGAEIDAEVIAMSARFWQELGIDDVVLQINSLGSNQARAAYRKTLVDYFSAHTAQLDEDSKRRLHSNPLRILDSKNPQMQALIEAAPKLAEHLDEEGKQHFAKLCELLDAMGVAYEITPRLVRGLDYYNHTVFEWVTTSLGAQGTICAGGRYDGLVEQIGGKPTPAFGFAMGAERLLALLEQSAHIKPVQQPDIYMVLQGDAAQKQGLLLAEQLRTQNPCLNILTNCDGGSFKAQFKRADKSGATYALILGEDEVANQTVVIKHLREDTEQQTLHYHEIGAQFSSIR